MKKNSLTLSKICSNFSSFPFANHRQIIQQLVGVGVVGKNVTRTGQITTASALKHC